MGVCQRLGRIIRLFPSQPLLFENESAGTSAGTNKHYERRAPPFTHVFSSFLYGDTTQRYEVPVAAMLLPGRRETVMFLLFVNGIPASRLLHPEEESFDNVSHEVSMLQVIGYA
jgi:hypothetical protein